MTKKEKFSTINRDDIVCPYCGHEHEYQGESGPYFWCHVCLQEFAYQIDNQPTFTSHTLEEYLLFEIKRMQRSISHHQDCIKYCETDISEIHLRLKILNGE